MGPGTPGPGKEPCCGVRPCAGGGGIPLEGAEPVSLSVCPGRLPLIPCVCQASAEGAGEASSSLSVWLAAFIQT